MISNYYYKGVMKQNGFSLIELLVVITIIGILTALFITNMVGVRERARDARVKADLNELKTALRLYYNDAQEYPDTGSVNVPAPGTTFSSGGTVYMNEVPQFDSYTQQNSGDGFLIQVELENEGDPDVCASWNRCGVTGSCAAGTETTNYVCAD
jgi:prepilin-type N-terminal cleavage/methylation domain-containing protein